VRSRGLVCASLLALALAPVRPGAADAQSVTPADVRTFPGTLGRDLPLLFNAQPAPDPWRSQRGVPPIDPRLMARLRRASDLRTAGLNAQARDTLLALERLAPGHPLLETELARTEMAMGQMAAAAERLRTLRAATRDTVVGAHDLSLALERLGRPREAAAVAIESWSVAPLEGAWALSQVLRLAPLDPRPVTEALRAAAEGRPARSDLLRGWALLVARQGQRAEAVKRLAAADAVAHSTVRRIAFADELTLSGIASDSLTAAEALVSVAGDPGANTGTRVSVARRALDLAATPEARTALAGRIAGALAGVPADALGPDLALDLARELRHSGHTADAQALLGRAARGRDATPDLELERLLGVLRDGPPERALPGLDSLARAWSGARFMRAEALFFAGELDSAATAYARAAEDASSDDAMTALDRAYQLEDDPGSPALHALGAVAYARWRGDAARARALSDSLWEALPRSSRSWAHAGMLASDVRADARDWHAALAPLLAIADSLPGDRLAPLARERAGDAYLALGDARSARAQFEECLARYPKAWNAAEVRRRLDPLRKARP
jgi:tetratricopeptide (TPR) repeat protein